MPDPAPAACLAHSVEPPAIVRPIAPSWCSRSLRAGSEAAASSLPDSPLHLLDGLFGQLRYLFHLGNAQGLALRLTPGRQALRYLRFVPLARRLVEVRAQEPLGEVLLRNEVIFELVRV